MQPRRWFQLHLSTAIAMTLVAGVLLSQVIPNSDYIAEVLAPPVDLEWNLKDTLGDFESSVKDAPPEYTYELIPKDEHSFQHFFVVRGPSGLALLSEEIQSENCTPFFIYKDILFYPRYCRISSGCEVRAFDLKSRSERWSTSLKGIGPVDHSQYSNEVRIKQKDHTLVVYGKEAAGNYVEILNLSTGKQIVNRSFNSPNFGAQESPLADLLLSLAKVTILTLAAGALFEFILRRTSRNP